MAYPDPIRVGGMGYDIPEPAAVYDYVADAEPTVAKPPPHGSRGFVGFPSMRGDRAWLPLGPPTSWPGNPLPAAYVSESGGPVGPYPGAPLVPGYPGVVPLWRRGFAAAPGKTETWFGIDAVHILILGLLLLLFIAIHLSHEVRMRQAMIDLLLIRPTLRSPT